MCTQHNHIVTAWLLFAFEPIKTQPSKPLKPPCLRNLPAAPLRSRLSSLMPTGGAGAMPTGGAGAMPTGETGAMPTGETGAMPTGVAGAMPTGGLGCCRPAKIRPCRPAMSLSHGLSDICNGQSGSYTRWAWSRNTSKRSGSTVCAKSTGESV